MVRELFVMAREAAPSIIFMDEIDSIGSSRVEGSEGGDSEVQRTMLELLNQLDGFEPTQNIKVSVILGIVVVLLLFCPFLLFLEGGAFLPLLFFFCSNLRVLCVERTFCFVLFVFKLIVSLFYAALDGCHIPVKTYTKNEREHVHTEPT